jgi:hypothetical protein
MAARDFAARDFTAVNLRRGRYAPAQLWKLTTIKGVGLSLADLVAPFLGDVHTVIPHDVAVISRLLGRMAIPREIPNNIRQVRVRVWANEVAGRRDLPVHHTTLRNFPLPVIGVLPANATPESHFCAEIRIGAQYDFEADWEEYFGAEWPCVRHRGHLEIHPALDQLWATSVDIEGRIVTINEHRLAVADRRRRRELAALLGLGDHHAVVVVVRHNFP